MNSKKLSQITKAEWVKYNWEEITVLSDAERVFLVGYERTPEEGARALIDWESFHSFLDDGK